MQNVCGHVIDDTNNVCFSATPSAWIFAVLISLALHAKLESARLSAFILTSKVD
ncbi:hypothetical protein ACE1ET_00380 [Saccharicrinis sp. FJH62]|uniref:hypothetical protein n=1 Tax=Saccharicrinis sp. FJH62 TaxID=3344657 RepID=UPI0035D4A5CE